MYSSSAQKSQLCPILQALPWRRWAALSLHHMPASCFERQWHAALFPGNLLSQKWATQTNPKWMQDSVRWQLCLQCNQAAMARASHCWWPAKPCPPALPCRGCCSCARPWRGLAACYGPPSRQWSLVPANPVHGCRLHGPVWNKCRARLWWSKAWRGRQMFGSKTWHSCRKWQQ